MGCPFYPVFRFSATCLTWGEIKRAGDETQRNDIHEYGWLSVMLPFVEQTAPYSDLQGFLAPVAAASSNAASRVPSSWPENEEGFDTLVGTTWTWVNGRNPFYRPISSFVYLAYNTRYVRSRMRQQYRSKNLPR